MSFLWFHYHRFDFTEQKVYKGLASMYLLFSADQNQDTGDEGTGFRLPSGAYDIPMIFADKVFDPTTGQLFFDRFNLNGILGDRYTVNGKIQPYLNVYKRRYRFRLLNGGPSRLRIWNSSKWMWTGWLQSRLWPSRFHVSVRFCRIWKLMTLGSKSWSLMTQRPSRLLSKSNDLVFDEAFRKIGFGINAVGTRLRSGSGGFPCTRNSTMSVTAPRAVPVPSGHSPLVCGRRFWR